jgi:hypothetical protein
MRKALAAGMAALTFGGAVAAAALPSAAEARDWRGGYHGGYGGYRGGYGYDRGRHHGNDAAAAAVIAGVAGLALGAALSSNNHGYYNRGYYNRGYYDRGYYGSNGYAPGYYDEGYAPYATCESRRWVWDPYIGRRVLVTSHYEC